MKWSMEVNEEKGVIVITLLGRWDAGGIFEALELLWKEQVRTGILRVLWDFREIDAVGVSTSKIREVASRQLTVRPDLPESKAAVVVSGDLEFGLARMAEAFIAQSPADMQIFRKLSEANAWLNEGG